MALRRSPLSTSKVAAVNYTSLRKRAYRADIDGLRAVAVFQVVAYHTFPRVFGGGFAGVDVFFVISGYLISRIIFAELGTDSFTFREFYARRIRRILPAMILVVVGSLIFGWRVLWPDEYALLGSDAAGAAGSVLNLLFWHRGSGYFDVSASNEPLIHLWSLGIEEQFYLAGPVLLVLAWRRRVLMSPPIFSRASPARSSRTLRSLPITLGPRFICHPLASGNFCSASGSRGARPFCRTRSRRFQCQRGTCCHWWDYSPCCRRSLCWTKHGCSLDGGRHCPRPPRRSAYRESLP